MLQRKINALIKMSLDNIELELGSHDRLRA